MFHKIMCEIAVSLKYSVPLDTIVVLYIREYNSSFTFHFTSTANGYSNAKSSKTCTTTIDFSSPQNFYLFIRDTTRMFHDFVRNRFFFFFFYLIWRRNNFVRDYIEKKKKNNNQFFFRTTLCRILTINRVRHLVSDEYFKGVGNYNLPRRRVSPRLLIAKRSSVGPVPYLFAISSRPFFSHSFPPFSLSPPPLFHDSRNIASIYRYFHHDNNIWSWNIPPLFVY